MVKNRSWMFWSLVAVGLLAGGAGVALGDGLVPQLHSMGMSAYAWLQALGRRLPLAVLIPAVALSTGYHASSRLTARRRQAQTRTAVATQPSIQRYAFLFAVAIFTAIVLAAMQY